MCVVCVPHIEEGGGNCLWNMVLLLSIFAGLNASTSHVHRNNFNFLLSASNNDFSIAKNKNTNAFRWLSWLAVSQLMCGAMVECALLLLQFHSEYPDK